MTYFCNLTFSIKNTTTAESLYVYSTFAFLNKTFRVRSMPDIGTFLHSHHVSSFIHPRILNSSFFFRICTNRKNNKKERKGRKKLFYFDSFNHSIQSEMKLQKEVFSKKTQST